MGWTPYTYYTSSPCEFYYACKGYFDKQEYEIALLRKVAMASSAGFVKSEDFEQFWPSANGSQNETPSWAATSIELRNKLLLDFNKRDEPTASNSSNS